MKKKTKSLTVLLVFLVLLIVIAFVSGNLADTVRTEYAETNLEELVFPSNDGNLISHTGFTLCYSEEHEQPLWVAYVLTPYEVETKAVKRNDNFRPDPMVPTGSATLADYRKSGYDRGHMAPFADLSWSEESGNDSFYLSNMSPQNGSLNRGKWAELEALVRSFAEEEPICIVTGPVLNGGPYRTIGENEISVPDFYYKVVLDYCGDERKAIGFVLPNEKCNLPLSSYIQTVDYVENFTGLDFFPLLPDDIEEKLESCVNPGLWGL